MIEFIKGLFNGKTSSEVMIFMDIDGVIHPHYAKDLGIRGYERVEGRYGQWHLHKKHGRWIKELQEEGATFVWETSWGREANEFVNPFYDLHPFPFIDYENTIIKPRALEENVTFKLPYIDELARNHPLVLIDDELSDDAFTWKQERKYPTLIINPEPNEGWTEAQKNQVLEFVREHDK